MIYQKNLATQRKDKFLSRSQGRNQNYYQTANNEPACSATGSLPLLANINATTKRKGFEGRKAESIIKNVKCYLLENINHEVDIK